MIRALMIEDEAQTQEFVGDILRLLLRHEVDIADNVQDARELVEQNDYAYILLDLGLPMKPGGRDARPDTGGLSGATPHEAVSWGKVDPERLPDAVVCYADTTIAMPVFTHCALAAHKKRTLKRLYKKRGQLMEALVREYFAHNK